MVNLKSREEVHWEYPKYGRILELTENLEESFTEELDVLLAEVSHSITATFYRLCLT